MKEMKKNKKLKELIIKKELIEIQKYINSKDFITYNFYKNGYFLTLSYGCFFKKTDDIKEIQYKGEEYYIIKKMINNGLFKIDDNIDAINKIVNNLKPFVIYEYYEKKGNIILTNWTANKEEKDLTGNVKIFYPMFYAYKLEEDILTNRCTKSDFVHNLNVIKDEYPYIKNDFFKYLNKDVNLNLNNSIRKLTK